MSAFGSELILVESDNRQITPELFTRMKAELARQAQAPDAFWAHQFHNPDAIAGYMPIGEEVAGTSSGLNVSAAVQLAAQLGPNSTVVTVACDSGLKYLSGDLYAK